MNNHEIYEEKVWDFSSNFPWLLPLEAWDPWLQNMRLLLPKTWDSYWVIMRFMKRKCKTFNHEIYKERVWDFSSNFPWLLPLEARDFWLRNIWLLRQSTRGFRLEEAEFMTELAHSDMRLLLQDLEFFCLLSADLLYVWFVRDLCYFLWAEVWADLSWHPRYVPENCSNPSFGLPPMRIPVS